MTFDENKSCLAKKAGTWRCCSAILLLLGLGTASYLSAWSPPPARPDARDMRPVDVTVANLTTPAPGERPNILWLIAEDTVKTNFGAYGNTYVKTPNIDRLATTGIRFDNASSTAPQCSPARATLISGTHATVSAPTFIVCRCRCPRVSTSFPNCCGDAGYYTTNNSKTDYNAKPWRRSRGSVECARAAQLRYKNPARAGRPFFSVFTNMVSHMDRLTKHQLNNRAGRRYRSEQRGAAAVRPGFANLA